jgi:putative hydrolase of the HAD superfamily
MFPFDVILFDIGGVILTDSWDHPERGRAAAHFHLDLDGLEARHRTQYNSWDCGRITMDDYLDAVVFNEPRNFSRDEFVSFLMGESRLKPDGAMSILQQISASHKCMVGSLNNEPRETNQHRFQAFGLRNYFQVAFSSCYLGVRKPDPAIFNLVLGVLGHPPERILFIDDRQPNVDAAAAMGISSIHFAGQDALRQNLVTLGVL